MNTQDWQRQLDKVLDEAARACNETEYSELTPEYKAAVLDAALDGDHVVIEDLSNAVYFGDATRLVECVRNAMDTHARGESKPSVYHLLGHALCEQFTAYLDPLFTKRMQR